MNPTDGQLTYLGEYDSKVLTFRPRTGETADSDGVLIAIDSGKGYIGTNRTSITQQERREEKDRTE